MKHMRVNVGSLFWLYRPLSTWMDFLLPPLRFNLSTALDAAGYGKRVPYKPAFQSAEKVRSSTGLPSGGDLTIRQSPFAFPGIFFISSCVSSALLAMVFGRHTTQSRLPVFGCVLATAAATSCRMFVVQFFWAGFKCLLKLSSYTDNLIKSLYFLEIGMFFVRTIDRNS